MKQLTARMLLFVFIVLPLLSGCDKSTTGKNFRYDIPGPVTNLDPQFATDTHARTIIGNLFEGLVTQSPDGTIQPGVAADYTVSEDKLTYTFTLRDGVCWSDGAPLTSDDFAFAFERIIGSNSPFSSDYISIKNAGKVLQGTQPVSSLGISTPDARTIIFELDYCDAFFLEALASTPAMPCNREYFDEARGRYGLEKKFTRGNGPFAMAQWDGDKVQLTANDDYISDSPTLAGNIYFYIGRDNPLDLFLDGKSDMLIISHHELEALGKMDVEYTAYDKTTWCIVFNQGDASLGNALIRQGLSLTADQKSLAPLLGEQYTTTSVFIPPAVRMVDTSFRLLAGTDSPMDHDPSRGEYLFQLGLEALEQQELSAVRFYVPDDGDHMTYMGTVQQNWQKHLSTYITLEPKPLGELQQSVAQGRYQMALVPFSPTDPRISSLLGLFSGESKQNHYGYGSTLYDSILLDALDEYSIGEAAELYAQAESQLLSDAVIIPVYFETIYYVYPSSVTGIEISPYAGRILFKGAQK